MKPDEIRKLLGGYATGTLTEAERNLLYSAALEDQELFDALADEEVLRAFLAEPVTRESLIEELQRQPVLESWSTDDRRVAANLAGSAAPAPVQPPSAEVQNSARLFWSRIWHDPTGRRWAVAAGLAILLIAGGIQYVRSHGQGSATVAMVNPATAPAVERPSSPFGAQPIARDQEPSPAVAASSTKPEARQATASQRADAGISDADAAKQKRTQTGSVELDAAKARDDQNRVAVIPAGGRDSAGPQQKAEKETVVNGAAREELNQAVRAQAAQERSKVAAESSVAPVASPPPPSLGASNFPATAAGPATPTQIVAGGLTSASPPSPFARKAAGLVGNRSRQLDAKVTDVNGTIVSINVGSNEGFHTGDVVEIVRDNRVIATSKLSQVGPAFAVGALQLAAGSAEMPRTGDVVRRAAAPRP